MALAFAPFGKEVSVTRIMADEKTRRHLENLGVIIGSRLTTMTDAGGDVIIRIKDGKLALNRALAMKILVA